MNWIQWAMLFALLTTGAMAQTIEGVVLDIEENPIPFATIKVPDTEIGTSADEEGFFQLELPTLDGYQMLEVSAVGFATVLVPVEDDDAVRYNFILSPNTQMLDQVMVTANKRDQSILVVPTAVTTLSAKEIEDHRLWDFNTLTGLVPNYLYQELGVGFQQVQSIRGIQVFSENPAVATYVDGVNNLDILANGFMLTDVERIEVLRGPQGTLFGRNAMGGVINITTKRPTNRTGGLAEVSVGNLGLQRYSVGFKTPLVKDRLFLGVTGLYQTRQGYWINDTTGLAAPTDRAIAGRPVGGENNLYGNMYLKWLPSNRFSATLNIKVQRDFSNSTGFFVSQRGGIAALDDPSRIQLARIGSHDRGILNGALALNYYASTFKITSISAYQSIRLAFEDVDFPGFYHSFFDDDIGEPLPPQQVFSQELRIQSTDNGPLQYTGGLYGFAQVGYEPSTNLAFELGPDQYAIFRNRGNNFGLAAFGEASYNIIGGLKVTAGLRLDFERRESTFNGFGDAVYAGGVLTEFRPDTTLGGNYFALSPKVAVAYQINPRSNVYLTYTRGFRAGGINAQRVPDGVRQTFDPEYSNNFELGYKSRWWNLRLTANVAAFFILWDDLQFFNLVAPFTYARENVGNAQSFGFEIETSILPIRGLRLDVSFGLNQTRYVDYAINRPSPVTGLDTAYVITGNQLSNAPGHTLFIGAQHDYYLGKDWKLMARVEFRHIGSFVTDIQNEIRQPAYALINARLGIAYRQFGLYLWGQNLNDARYLAFGNPDTSFGNNVRTAMPRTFGATLQAQF